MKRITGIAIITAALLCQPQPALGQDEAGGLKMQSEALDSQVTTDDQARPGAIYIPLKPPFVVNYGGAGRLKFIKADLTVRLEDADAANALRHHMPYVRNNIVLLLSAQTDESISSQEGKEALRQEALREVRGILRSEEGRDGVVDLYFTGFVIQK